MTRKLIVVIAAVLLAFGAYFVVKQFFTSGLKTEVKLGNERAKAGTASGSDAVETVTNRAATDQEALRQAEETKDEIDRQVDAAGVTDAGRRGLCDREPSRRGCGVVQQPPSK